MNSGTSYWFKSSMFEAEAGEDDETNPRKYGRQLATWLRTKVLALGYPVEDVFGEDWGWCVMCQRDPYLLWIGCVNREDYAYAKEGDPPPSKERLLWNATPVAEVPFLRYLLMPKPDTQLGLQKLDAELRDILESEPNIQIVDDSVAGTWHEGAHNDDSPSRLTTRCNGGEG
jgi:hypothetical protein